MQDNWRTYKQRLLEFWRATCAWLRVKLQTFMSLAIQQLPVYKEKIGQTLHAGWLRTSQRAGDCWRTAAGWLRRNEPTIRDRLWQYTQLMRLDKPIGSWLLLWPTLWALWIAADGLPTLHLLLVFGAGVFLTRSAGCVMNDYADRNFDRYVARTRNRPLTSGKVSPREAWYLIAILLTLAFLLVLTTNRLTVLLSLIALPLGGFYPFMKRYTYIPQLFQGMAFGWGIPMAFAAASDSVPRIAWLIYIANIFWSMSYDTVYAMVDREDDKKIGVKSTAILFEDNDRFFVGLIQIMLLLTLVFIGLQLHFSSYYYTALVAVAGIVIHLQFLIKDRVPAHCFQAFRRNNWLGAVVFAGIVLHYYHSVTY